MSELSQNETYTHGHHPSVVTQHSRRTAEEAARFLLPKLQPGMNLLDVGCGPGSITAGLAKYVDPGNVIGIDADSGVLETARDLNHGVSNLRFAEGDVYALPFEDDSFDVAYAHQLMQHLGDPAAALREMGRVVRSGGFVAARDSDYQTMICHPRTEEIEEWRALYTEVVRRNGADANAGRRIPAWFNHAGFNQIEVSTTVAMMRDSAELLNWGDSWAERVTNSKLADQALAYGLANQSDLERIATGWRDWARNEEALFLFVHVEGLAAVS
ncbi:MAG: SAM-dependent methyltransferase [Dehalococcoidia bacterium]|nr:SAM-dependent methyltransferase [Dehalococcoidia bacterium]HCV00955.1 SAM-dependent methyltransferase [Dehalococcoidia bacterium]|tara:strand:+ start:174 stop:986 length:813 start_codon:yes stop_codon:yes gene_type:complete